MNPLRLKKTTFITILFLIAALTSGAQINLKDYKLQENKRFQKNIVSVLKSKYTDENGIPSHEIFLKTKGLYHFNNTIKSVPVFTFSCKNEEVILVNGKSQPGASAELLNLDFHVQTEDAFYSPNQALPLTDGRVYLEENNLVVAGYSAKYNERPLGKINENGEFVQELSGEEADNFPLLKQDLKQMVYDPFTNTLFRTFPANNRKISETSKKYLPIDIFSEQGEILTGMQFKLEYDKPNKLVILFGIKENKKTEIASCPVVAGNISGSKTGYSPSLIEGCTQPLNGKVVSFTLGGKFSENIIAGNSGLILKKDSKSEISQPENEKPVAIDGNFDEWRNKRGMDDAEGDYVSYLCKNPDTDLLEFKITNDEKYLYFYSRVAGAFGRTGENGRYYWYSYIDVDSNPKTGYPPTRDDNCYFGIPIGDDCEAQFEFVGNRFVKTFFGFTGNGAEKEALSGILELGASYYSATGQDGSKRDIYKVEYVNRKNSRFITHDNTDGTSEDIVMALSPDGSEMELRVEMKGFLKDKTGKDLVQRGNKIDVAVGAEGAGDHLGFDEWGADSTPVFYNYEIK